MVLWVVLSGVCGQFTFFFFNDTATTEIYTLSLHDALPIYTRCVADGRRETMSDPKVLWGLCPHGQGPSHYYSIDDAGASQGNLRCPGGKKYIMRQVESDEIYGLIEYGEDYPVLVWMEVTE